MKKITETIVKQLNNEDFLVSFEALVSSNPNALQGDVTIAESLDRYLQIKEILLQSAKTGVLDNIPYSRRNALSSHLNAAFQYRNNHTQLTSQIEAAYDQVLSSGLFAAQVGQNDYQAEIKEISKLKKRLNQLISKFEETEANQNLINSTKEGLESLVSNANEQNDKVVSLKSSSEATKALIVTYKSDAETLKNDIQCIISSICTTKSHSICTTPFD